MKKVKIIISIDDGNHEIYNTIDFARWAFEEPDYCSEDIAGLELRQILGYMGLRTLREMYREFLDKHGPRVQAERKIIKTAHKRLAQLNEDE